MLTHTVSAGVRAGRSRHHHGERWQPAGAVVAGAMVEARNTDTGGLYPTQSTSTGNYTLSELPAGPLRVSVTVCRGSSKYVRQGLTIQVAVTLRADVKLEVGDATQSVTVTEAAALLRRRRAT